jgi:hypothetical protein
MHVVEICCLHQPQNKIGITIKIEEEFYSALYYF